MNYGRAGFLKENFIPSYLVQVSSVLREVLAPAAIWWLNVLLTSWYEL